jgi:hypothetical protein
MIATLLLGWVLQLALAMAIATVGWMLAGWMVRRLSWSGLAWIEQLALGALIVIVLLAVGGVLMALVPFGVRRLIGLAVLAGVLVASVVGWRRGAWLALRSAPLAQRLAAGATLALAALALGLAWWPARLPSVLIDGPYVVKQDLPVVRVQHIGGTLPIDNAVPHVASEYLLRGISFGNERPMLPGQEMSNRPVLVSFVLMPWRALLAMPPEQQGPMPRFVYVGTSWPDFSVLLQDRWAWAVSVSIGTALNALLLLAVGAWLTVRRKVAPAMVVAFALLALSSPYVLIQTFFTWPKALAGFFIVLAYLAARRGLSPWVTGVVLGLAYWSHPYAMVYAGGFGLWWLWRGLTTSGAASSGLRLATYHAISFVVVIAPWFIWTRIWLDIPSDLVAQNFLQAGQRWIDFAWVRMLNLLTTLAPMHLQVYPYEIGSVIRNASVNVTGALGLLPALWLLRAWMRGPWDRQAAVWLPLLVPALLLVTVFSIPAVPAVHGLQPLILLGLAVAVAQVWTLQRERLLWLLVLGQVVVNGVLLGRHLMKML